MSARLFLIGNYGSEEGGRDLKTDVIGEPANR